MLHNRRLLNLMGFAACASMLVFAVLVQKLMHLEPCPLCVFQRVGIALVGCIFLLAALFHPRGSLGARIWGLLIALATLLPIGVASRHIWVQAQPEGSVPSCGATLDYMLEVFPLLQVVRQVLSGGGECAKIDWRFLGLTMPMWVFISSLALAVFALWASGRTPPRDGVRFSA
jgi:disulfide bond formation protein DsbB